MVEQPAKQSYFADMAAKEAAAKRSSVVDKACQWVVNNQISWSAGLLAVIHAHDFFFAGGDSRLVHLQHRIPSDAQGRYARGREDIYFILHWAIAFTLIRATIMYKILEPFAKWYGVKSVRKVTRFAEQGWLTIYYILSNSTGLYVMYHHPHWMNTSQFWANYPEGHRQMTALMKSYYLIQMGFWVQQIFVLLVEERRKDFVVMFIHHIVTCNLMGWSLFTNYTRVGNAVLCCMDSSDIFLSGTKCMRYLGFERAAVVSFVVFIVSWIYTRHYLYYKITHSVFYETYDIIGPNTLWDPENGAFYSRASIGGFTFLLCTLQVLIIYWFALVLRIIYRIVTQNNLDDSRSDSEDNDGDDGAGNKATGTSSKASKRKQRAKSKDD
ncbi:Sphingosine N-acyltransferase lag1 [Coemansia sp. IMI 209128]|nr:Sphingosine N-acyltransferase lag1 [Coemansia sp. RSA 2530]KAJ2703387.1 Sphingosine N-acyltransferase lag1 [Coemansia sp. IMI 209128]